MQAETQKIQTQTTIQRNKNGQTIDFWEMAQDYLRCVRKFWFVLILLAAVTAVITGMVYCKMYTPVYQSKITYAVDKSGDATIDGSISARLSMAVPALADIKEFQDDMKAEFDQKLQGGYYKLSSVYTESTTLFDITVTAGSAADANMVLAALQKVYPKWASSTTSAVDLQTVDLSECAGAPVNPFSKLQTLMYAVFAGLLVCFAFATVYVLTLKTVRNESVMKKITSKPCLSLIPKVKLKKRSKNTEPSILITNKRIDWGFKESVLSLQTRVENHMKKQQMKVLLVSSTIPQEGKSLLTVNLALAFARQGKKVLIIEGDLRNPTVEKTLAVETKKGLTEYFAGDGAVAEMIVSKDGVDVLGAGTEKTSAAALLKDKKMNRLMEALRATYHYILIDTPPVHLFTDASIWMRYADASLYVVQHDAAAIGEIRDGLTNLGYYDKMIGYVINQVHGSLSSYGKYGYGYGYGKYGRYGRYGRYGHYSKYGHYSHYGEQKDTEEEQKAEETLDTEKTL